MGAIGDLNVRLGMEVKKFNRDIRGAERRLNKFAKNTARIGSSLTTNLTLPIVGIGVGAVKMASDFEFSMTKIVSQVGLTTEEVDGLKKSVLELSGQTGRAPKELAEGMFFVESAGLRGAKALNALEFSAKGAATGYGETKIVADLLTSTMNAYAASNMTAEKSMDILAATVKEGKAEASELTAVMGGALPQAVAMGIGFDQLGGSVAAMTRTGTPAAAAVTQLKSIMMVFQKPSKEAEKIAAKLGFTFGELRDKIKKEGLLNVLVALRKKLSDNGIETAEFFRKSEALNGVLDLTGDGLEENIKIMKRMADTTGTANKAFEEAAKTSQFKFTQSLAKLKVAGIEMGNALMPIATDLAGGISSLAQAFSGLDSSTQKTIIKTGLFVAAMGPALTVTSKLITLYKVSSIELRKIGKGLELARTAYMRTMVAQRAAAGGVVTFTGALKSAKVAFMAFNAVSKAATIGLVIAAVSAAVLAFKEWNQEIDLVSGVMKDANKSIAGQKKQTELLTETIQSETSTLEDKEAALNKLKGISQEYYGHLVLEKGQVEGLTTATNNYVASLLRQAKVKAAGAKIDELAAKQFELQQLLKDLESKTGGARFLNEAAGGIVGAGNASANLKKQIADLEQQMTDLGQVQLDNIGNVIPPLAESADDAVAEMYRVAKAAEDLNKLLAGGKPKGEGTKKREEAKPVPQLARIATDFKKITLESENAGAAMAAFAENGMSIEQVVTRADELKAIFAGMNEQLNEILESGTDAVFSDLGAAMGSAIVNAKSFSGAMASVGSAVIGTLANVLGEVGKLAIATGIAVKGIKISLKSLNPLVAIAGGIALVALSKAVPKLLAKKVPGFQMGKDNFSGGLAMVGETGPEVVGLPRGSAVMNNRKMAQMMNGGGSSTIIPDVRISGNDLLILFERATHQKNRIG